MLSGCPQRHVSQAVRLIAAGSSLPGSRRVTSSVARVSTRHSGTCTDPTLTLPRAPHLGGRLLAIAVTTAFPSRWRDVEVLNDGHGVLPVRSARMAPAPEQGCKAEANAQPFGDAAKFQAHRTDPLEPMQPGRLPLSPGRLCVPSLAVGLPLRRRQRFTPRSLCLSPLRTHHPGQSKRGSGPSSTIWSASERVSGAADPRTGDPAPGRDVAGQIADVVLSGFPHRSLRPFRPRLRRLPRRAVFSNGINSI